ncbi:MAG: ABC transporter permease [Candidatus Methylacidiphilales bacterium]|nr:ABC transporter permease [Candidatus Methylacidiphilales bacterium]
MAYWTLLKKELWSIFVSPVAYAVLMACSLSIAAIFVYCFSAINGSNITFISVLQACATLPTFWILVMFQVPVMTMRTFAEEFKMGTMEMLLTAPIREWEVVLAKYTAAFLFFVLAWVPLAVNITYLHIFTNPAVPFFFYPTALTFLGIVIVGMFFVSVGIFTSVITRNQIVSAILAFVFIFVYFFIGLLSYLKLEPWTFSFLGMSLSINIPEIASYMSVLEHMSTFARGVFDSRPVVLYFSGTILMLFLTQRALLARRLQS